MTWHIERSRLANALFRVCIETVKTVKSFVSRLNYANIYPAFICLTVYFRFGA